MTKYEKVLPLHLFLELAEVHILAKAHNSGLTPLSLRNSEIIQAFAISDAWPILCHFRNIRTKYLHQFSKCLCIFTVKRNVKERLFFLLWSWAELTSPRKLILFGEGICNDNEKFVDSVHSVPKYGCAVFREICPPVGASRSVDYPTLRHAEPLYDVHKWPSNTAIANFLSERCRIWLTETWQVFSPKRSACYTHAPVSASNVPFLS